MGRSSAILTVSHAHNAPQTMPWSQGVSSRLQNLLAENDQAGGQGRGQAHLRVLLLMTRKVRSGACARAAGKEPLKLLKDVRTFTRELLTTLG